MAGLLPWKALIRYSQTAQILPKPWDLSECVYGCPYVYKSVCKGVDGDYGGAFTLSGQRDGSAPSLAPPIPDHSPGISRFLSHTESTALNSPSTEPKSSNPLNFTALFLSLWHLIHPFGEFLSLLPSSLSEVDFWCEKTAREQVKGQQF